MFNSLIWSGYSVESTKQCAWNKGGATIFRICDNQISKLIRFCVVCDMLLIPPPHPWLRYTHTTNADIRCQKNRNEFWLSPVAKYRPTGMIGKPHYNTMEKSIYLGVGEYSWSQVAKMRQINLCFKQTGHTDNTLVCNLSKCNQPSETLT